jgi:phage nucleotide-binding protein
MTNELVDPKTLLETHVTTNSQGEETIEVEIDEVVNQFGGLDVVKAHQRSPYINMLVYGKSGVGKTQLLGSANDVKALAPILLLDVEGGTETLRHTYPDVEVVRIHKWQQIANIYTELRRGNHKYKTFGIDSLTELQKFNMYNVMEQLAVSRPDLDKDIPGMREWGKNLEQIRRFVRTFRDLQMNVIFTALDREEKNDKTGAMQHQPSLSGKLASEVAAFLDIVVYYYVRTQGKGEEQVLKRLMLTKLTDTTVAKDRTGKLPMLIEEPSLKKLWDHIFINQITPTNTTKDGDTVNNTGL